MNDKPSLRERLIPLLADGEFHSGERLAQSLGVSRAAIWKTLNGLEESGIELHRVPKRGYRLPRSIELLDAGDIEAKLASKSRQAVRHLQVLQQTDSTNAQLLAVKDLPAGKADVCLAEFQSAGRGRRGRKWIAPFGSSLCLSVSWLFPETPSQIGTLSLAAGVAVLRALGKFAVKDLSLKWPNDVFLERRKLGGILIELRAESAGPAYVVLGIGLNLHLTAAARQSIRESAGVEAASLADGLSGRQIGRNVLATAVIDRLITALTEFQQHGFRSFAQEWREADALSGVPVQVLLNEETHKGIARGIDEDGALLLETSGKLSRFTSGEVSLRPGA